MPNNIETNSSVQYTLGPIQYDKVANLYAKVPPIENNRYSGRPEYNGKPLEHELLLGDERFECNTDLVSQGIDTEYIKKVINTGNNKQPGIVISHEIPQYGFYRQENAKHVIEIFNQQQKYRRPVPMDMLIRAMDPRIKNFAIKTNTENTPQQTRREMKNFLNKNTARFDIRHVDKLGNSIERNPALGFNDLQIRIAEIQEHLTSNNGDLSGLIPKGFRVEFTSGNTPETATLLISSIKPGSPSISITLLRDENRKITSMVSQVNIIGERQKHDLDVKQWGFIAGLLRPEVTNESSFLTLGSVQGEFDPKIELKIVKDKIEQLRLKAIYDHARSQGKALSRAELKEKPYQLPAETRIALKKRKEALMSEYKEKLRKQMKGVAKAEGEILKEWDEDVYMSPNNIQNKVKLASKKYGMTFEQQLTLYYRMEKLIKIHQGISQLLREHSGNINQLLFDRIGFLSKRKITFSQNAANLHIVVENIEEYTRLIRAAGYSPETVSESVGGASLNVCELVPGYRGGLTVGIDAKSVILDHSIETHEHNHVVFDQTGHKTAPKNFIENIGDKKNALEMQIIKECSAKNEAQKNTADEILAYFRQGMSFSEIKAILTKPVKDGGIYDHYRTTRENWKKDIAYERYGFELSKNEIDRVIDKLMSDGNYERFIDRSQRAISKLQRVGYNKEEIFALLAGEKPSRWPRVVRRVLGENPKNSVPLYRTRTNPNSPLLQ